MMRNRIVGSILLLLTALSVSAQKAERNYIRKGNRAYKDSTYVNAEVNYRKAIDANPASAVAMYNLGNTLMQQNKLQEAMEQFVTATKMEKDKNKLAQIYHNMGVIFHAGKDYEKAIEAYKESLRNNPKDDETRYNLALAQKMRKDQQNQQNQKSASDKVRPHLGYFVHVVAHKQHPDHFSVGAVNGGVACIRFPSENRRRADIHFASQNGAADRGVGFCADRAAAVLRDNGGGKPLVS